MVAFHPGSPSPKPPSPKLGLFFLEASASHLSRLLKAQARCRLMMLWTAPPPARECHDVGAAKAPTIRRSQIMEAITTIGLDIAKSVFQVL